MLFITTPPPPVESVKVDASDRKKLDRAVEVLRAGHVKRFHAIDTIKSQSVAEHTFGTLVIARELCSINNVEFDNVASALLYHDAPEHYTGDIPANVKKDSPDLACALSDLEESYTEHYDIPAPDLLSAEARIVRAADTLEAMFFCLRERSLGNVSQDLSTVFDRLLTYLVEFADLRGVRALADGIAREFAD